MCWNSLWELMRRCATSYCAPIARGRNCAGPFVDLAMRGFVFSADLSLLRKNAAPSVILSWRGVFLILTLYVIFVASLLSSWASISIMTINVIMAYASYAIRAYLTSNLPLTASKITPNFVSSPIIKWLIQKSIALSFTNLKAKQNAAIARG